MGVKTKIQSLEMFLLAIILVCSFSVISKANTLPASVFPMVDYTLQDLLERYENMDQQNFWHPNSFNSGLQSREVIKISRVTNATVPGIYTQWKSAHLGIQTIFAGLTTNRVVLFDDNFKEIHSINTTENLVALAMFTTWNDVYYESELVLVVATKQPSVQAYSYMNNNVTYLGSWPLHHQVKSLELCTVDISRKIIVVPQNSKGSIDIYNFKAEGNSSQLWFFQSLKLDTRTCFVVHDDDTTCSMAYADKDRSIGLITYDFEGRLFHEQTFIQNVSNPCKQLVSFSLSYSQYLAYVPKGSNHTVQFYSDTGKGQLNQNLKPIQAVEMAALPVSDHREDILLVKSPTNSTKLYSYDGVSKLFKETYSCPAESCNIEGSLLNGASALVNGSTTVYVAATKSNRSYAQIFIIQSEIEEYGSPLFDRARQIYTEFQALSSLYNRFQRTVMETRSTLDDSIDTSRENIVTGNWTVKELSSYNVVMRKGSATNYTTNQTGTFNTNFGTIEFIDNPLSEEDFYVQDSEMGAKVNHLQALVQRIQNDAENVVPLDSTTPVEVLKAQNILADVQSSSIEGNQLFVNAINDVERIPEFFHGLATYGSSTGIIVNRNIAFEGHIETVNLITNYINTIPTNYFILSSESNKLYTPIMLKRRPYIVNNVTAEKIAGLHIPQDVYLATDASDLIFEGNVTATKDATVIPSVGGVRIDQTLTKILSEKASQVITSDISFRDVVLRNISKIKYINGKNLNELIESIVLKNHQGPIKGKKEIDHLHVNANSLNIGLLLNSIPFPDGFIRKSDVNVTLFGTKHFHNITVDKVTIDGYINGLKPDNIVRLNSTGHVKNNAKWTLHDAASFVGDIRVKIDVAGIPVSRWNEDHYKPTNFLNFPNHELIIKNPVVLEELHVEHLVNKDNFQKTFGDAVKCKAAMDIHDAVFQNGVLFGDLRVENNKINGKSIGYLNKHKEQNITKNFVFRKPVQFFELIALSGINGTLFQNALKDIILTTESISWPSQLKFASVLAKSDVTIIGPINGFNTFGKDIAVKRGKSLQTFESSLAVKYLTSRDLNVTNLTVSGNVNGLNVTKWEDERVALSDTQTWNHPVEITGQTTFSKNLLSSTVNGESLDFLATHVLRMDNENQAFLSPVIINGLVLARGSVKFNGTLNGYSFNDVLKDALLVNNNGSETVNAFWRLENAVFHNLTVTGKTCGVDLAQLNSDSVRKDASNVHFRGQTSFNETLNITKLKISLLNSISISSFFTKNTDQDLRDNYKWNRDIQVQDKFSVYGKINNNSLEAFRLLYSFTNNTHVVNSTVVFKNSFDARILDVKGLVQSRNFSKFISSLVKVNVHKPQIILSPLNFTQSFISEANVECTSVNGIHVSDLANRLVPKDRSEFTFTTQTCFSKPVQTDTLFVESGDIQTDDGKVGSISLQDLTDNFIPIFAEDPLSIEEMFFEDLNVEDGLQGVRYINGVPIEKLLTRNTPQHLQSIKVANLTLLQEHIEGSFGGVNVKKAYEDTFLSTKNSGTVTGYKTFIGSVIILKNLRTGGKITKSLVFMNGNNVITTPIVFEDHVKVLLDMTLLGKWNNYSLYDIKHHGVSKYSDEVISTRWNFPNGLVLVNSSDTYGLIDGMSFTQVIETSQDKVRDLDAVLNSERRKFNDICQTFQKLQIEAEKSPLKLQSFDEQQIIFTQQKVTNMLTLESGANVFLLVSSDTCVVHVYKWSTVSEEFHESGLALIGESIDKWVQSSISASAIIVFSTSPSACGRTTTEGLYYTIFDATGNFSSKKLINSGAVVDFKLVKDKSQGSIALFVVFNGNPESIVIYSWSMQDHKFVLETSLNISSLIRTLDVNKLRNGDVEILLQTVSRVIIAVYSWSEKSLTKISNADFYGSSKSMKLFRADKSLYALVSTRETGKAAIKPDSNLQLFLATRGELQFLQKLTVYDLISMEVVRLGNQVYVLVLTKPVGLYVYKFMGLSGLQSVNVHPLKFYGEQMTTFSVKPWHYDAPLPFVLISNGKMIKLFHSNVIGNAVISLEDKHNATRICDIYL